MNVDCQFAIYSKSLERFCGLNTAYRCETDVILLLGILHFARLILNPMHGIHLRFTTSSVLSCTSFQRLLLTKCPCQAGLHCNVSIFEMGHSSFRCPFRHSIQTATPSNASKVPQSIVPLMSSFYTLAPFILTFCNCRCP
jgi:hypothetical protein